MMTYDYEIQAPLFEAYPPLVTREIMMLKTVERTLSREKQVAIPLFTNDYSTIIAALRGNGWSFKENIDEMLHFTKGRKSVMLGYEFHETVKNNKGYLTLRFIKKIS